MDTMPKTNATNSLHRKTLNPVSYNMFMYNYIHPIIQEECSQYIEPAIYENGIIKNKIDITLAPQIKLANIDINRDILTLYSEKKNLKNLLSLNPKIKSYNNDPEIPLLKYSAEFFIGLMLNELRRKLPYFAYTYALISRVAVIDFIQQPYSIMQENIHGHTMAYIIDNKKLTAKQFYTFILQIACALQKAQDKTGFMHNALYPENIIIRKEDISQSTFKISSRIYTINPEGEIPTIIDFSSARVAHKGFGVCYFNNPTIFTPGTDLCKLLSSCLVRIYYADKELYSEVSWLEEYFDNYFPSPSQEKSYEKYYQQHSFNIPYDSIIANSTPISFIQWFQQKQGELFPTIVKIKSRELSTKIMPINKEFAQVAIKSMRSAIMKAYTLYSAGTLYQPTDEEIAHDKMLLDDYNKILQDKTSYDNPLVICYNFPFDIQFEPTGNKLTRYDPKIMLNSIRSMYDILSSYLNLLRQAKTIGKTMVSQDILESLYIKKAALKHNKHVLQNIALYKLYQLTAICDGMNIVSDGSTAVLDANFDDIIIYLIQQYPQCKTYIRNIRSKTDQRLVDVLTRVKKPLYYPPSSLEQIYQLTRLNIKGLSFIINKLIFGGASTDTKIINNIRDMLKMGYSDVEIFEHFKTCITPSTFTVNRGDVRAREVKNVFMGTKKSSLPSIKSYLDFGGGSGEISAAVAKLFSVPKEQAYSADINNWFNHSTERCCDSVTYIHLKENANIPLEDKSIDLITCFQVLHHIKDMHYIIKELTRVCASTILIREHNCEGVEDKMLIDIEHSLFEMCIEKTPNIKYLNDYEAWYRSKREWNAIFRVYGFLPVESTYKVKYSSSKYYYSIYKRA